MPNIKSTMMNRRSDKSFRTGICGKFGKIAVSTCGIVSPTITQKATMPPKALQISQSVVTGSDLRVKHTRPIALSIRRLVEDQIW